LTYSGAEFIKYLLDKYGLRMALCKPVSSWRLAVKVSPSTAARGPNA